MNEAATATPSGTKYVANSIPRPAFRGSENNAPPATIEEASNAHPVNALAAYQTSGLELVMGVLKPYVPFGGTSRRINGTLIAARRIHDATNCDRYRSAAPGSRPSRRHR